jgi:molybdopterin-guanine dinucleotide biosynthesis protein A
MSEATPNVAGFVLAGGRSLRMGQDKTLLKLGGVPMLLRTAQLVESVVGSVAVIGRPGLGQGIAQELGLRIVPDDWPAGGPLGGMATALRVTTSPWSLVVACDLPYLTQSWLEYLVSRALASSADAVLPMNALGAEPLCAMYHKRSEPAIRRAMESGTRKVHDALASIRIEPIESSQWREFSRDGSLFRNMNSPADYEEAKAKFG